MELHGTAVFPLVAVTLTVRRHTRALAPCTLGPAAHVLRVPRRRLQWWSDQGWLSGVTPVGRGTGRHRILTPDELETAWYALAIARTLGLTFLSRDLFRHTRAALRRAARTRISPPLSVDTFSPSSNPPPDSQPTGNGPAHL